jgi:hypothetical protein
VEVLEAGRPRPARLLGGLAWAFVVLRAGLTVWDLRLIAAQPDAGMNLYTAGAVQWALVPVTFAILGAFVVTRRPGNVIGWLLLAPGMAVSLPVAELGAAPAETGFLLLAQLWYVNVSWVLVIFPILLMLALFPTGRPLSPRWRWHTWVVVGMGGFFLLLVAVLERLGPPDGAGDWTVANPIGFLGDLDAGPWFGPIWTAGLLVITLGAAASMLVRFRRAGWLERQQLKWLLYAVTVFGVVYSAAAIAEGWGQASWLALLFGLSVLFVPVCMTIAILRHRVFDIDVIIRRTATYTVITTLSTAVFLGSVVLFQGLARQVTGVDSSLGVAASTLLVAALFNPLRRRTQAVLGRRFFRNSYELELTLAGFAARARSETDIDRVFSDLLGVVDDALHPRAVSVLLLGTAATRPTVHERRADGGGHRRA